MSLWRWNDVELEIDMEDVEFLERYENAFDNMELKETELQKTGKKSAIARDYCDMFYRLFDDIFGQGTGEKLLGEKKNVRNCEECYDAFLSACQKCVIEANKRQNALENKFKPNRAQRRAAGKK